MASRYIHPKNLDLPWHSSFLDLKHVGAQPADLSKAPLPRQ